MPYARFSCLLILNLLLWAGLMGCAAHPPGQVRLACAQADWQALGWRDARAGRQPATMMRHQQRCVGQGVTPNRLAYLVGWQAGAERLSDQMQTEGI